MPEADLEASGRESAAIAVVEHMAARMRRDSKDQTRSVLRSDRRTRRGFERRLWRRWGRAFDLFDLVTILCTQFGAEANKLHRPSASERQDFTFEALVLIHARACSITREIAALLRGGFPDGAGARGRTLYEAAVVAFALHRGGRDVAERFLLHDIVGRAKDARAYLTHQGALGLEPLEESEVEELEADAAKLCERFGKEFRKDYGWAAELFKGSAPNLHSLADFVGLDHLDPYYRAANHEIHSGGRAAALTMIDFRGQDMLRAGSMNSGLAEPGHGALISLIQITTCLLTHCDVNSDHPSFTGAAESRCIATLSDEAGEAFGAAQAAIDRAERRYAKSLSRRKRRRALSRRLALAVRRGASGARSRWTGADVDHEAEK